MFDGVHGCYLYQGRDVTTDKLQNLKGHMLVAAPHEGLVSSEQWLNCRIKLFGNKTIQANQKGCEYLAGRKGEVWTLWICADEYQNTVR